MSFHPNELQEQSSRSSLDRPELFASIAAGSWTRQEMQPGRNPTPELPAFLDFGNQAALYGKDSLRFSDRTLLAQLETSILPEISFQNSPVIRAADVIVRDTNDSKHILPALTIDSLEIAQSEPKIDPRFKDKGDAEEGVDHEIARRLSQVLPHLAHYSERHNGIGSKLIGAIIRNEHGYRGLDDSIQDAIVSKTGNAVEQLPKGDFTIGPGQVKLSNIRDLQHKYAGLFADVNTSDLSRMATDKTFSTALVAAYLDDRAKTLESWTKHPPDVTRLSKDEQLLYKYSLPLWKSGQETKALISSFNPGDGSAHIKNVLRQLELIDQGQAH